MIIQKHSGYVIISDGAIIIVGNTIIVKPVAKVQRSILKEYILY